MDEASFEVVWSLSNLFLDTEVRDWVIAIADTCVESGLTDSEIRNIWKYQVTPAVYFNLLTIGEWDFFDKEWLKERVEEVQKSRLNRPGVIGGLVYFLRSPLVSSLFKCVERAVKVLRKEKNRKALRQDLTDLAGLIFYERDSGSKEEIKKFEDNKEKYLVLLEGDFKYIYGKYKIPKYLPSIS